MSAGYVAVWVVQERQSGEFLYPAPDGDCGFTKFLCDAGRFYDLESAVDTAQLQLGDDYRISGFHERA